MFDMGIVGTQRLMFAVFVVACSVDGGTDNRGNDGTGGNNSGGTKSGSGGSTAKGGSTASGGSSTSSGGSSSSGATGGTNAAGEGSGGTNAAGNSGSGTGGTAIINPPVGAPLIERIRSSEVTVAAGVKAGVSNWRIWKTESLVVAPVYAVPLTSCGMLVCFTTGNADSPVTRIVQLDAEDKLVKELVKEDGVECRGLAAEPDGHFGALLWDDGGDSIRVKRYDTAGATLSTTELKNGDNKPDDFGIGESRLEFGGDKYGAYYHVHSDSGHEGDTYKFVSTAGVETTTWGWGCSHSMSNLLRYNPTNKAFLPVCVTDCYPGTSGTNFASTSIGGVYLSNKKKVIDVDAGCNGSVAGELGGAAIAPDGWKLTFNAHQNPATLGQKSYSTSTMNQDIGYSEITGKQVPSAVVWLTSTPSINEADSTITRWQPKDEPVEQYIVGWVEPGSKRVHKLGRIDPKGKFLEAPVDVSAKVQWGRRDDPFREHQDRDIVWAWFDKAGSTTLRIGRIESSTETECKPF